MILDGLYKETSKVLIIKLRPPLPVPTPKIRAETREQCPLNKEICLLFDSIKLKGKVRESNFTNCFRRPVRGHFNPGRLCSEFILYKAYYRRC